MDLFSVKDRVAVVTGASSGIGHHIAGLLAENGAKVVATARRTDRLDALADKYAGQMVGVAADITSQGVGDELAEPFGVPDILVSCAGLNPRKPADEMKQSDWDATIAINLTAPYNLARAYAPEMAKRGFGRIINFASLQSFRAFPAGMAYGATKGGVAQLTRAMAQEWGGQGITANAIGPGFFETELTAAVFADPERAARNAAQTCIGRNGVMTDMDGPILFLASEASSYVTGQILMVDGGFTAR